MLKNLRSGIIILVFIFVAISSASAEERECRQVVVVSNSTGTLAFGKISNPPGGKQDGIWFPIAPRAIAIDLNGDIYVGDSVNYRVLKFSNKGEFLLAFKLQPPKGAYGITNSPLIRTIGIDANDNVHVWNYSERRIEIYDHSGTFKEFSNFARVGQKDIFKNVPKGEYASYTYEISSYIPDKKLPGHMLFSITVKKGSDIVAKCKGVDLAFDEGGLIYSFDGKGNIYTFDYYQTLNVIKINPFK